MGPGCCHRCPMDLQANNHARAHGAGTSASITPSQYTVQRLTHPRLSPAPARADHIRQSFLKFAVEESHETEKSMQKHSPTSLFITTVSGALGRTPRTTTMEKSQGIFTLFVFALSGVVWQMLPSCLWSILQPLAAPYFVPLVLLPAA